MVKTRCMIKTIWAAVSMIQPSYSLGTMEIGDKKLFQNWILNELSKERKWKIQRFGQLSLSFRLHTRSARWKLQTKSSVFKIEYWKGTQTKGNEIYIQHWPNNWHSILKGKAAIFFKVRNGTLSQNRLGVCTLLFRVLFLGGWNNSGIRLSRFAGYNFLSPLYLLTAIFVRNFKVYLLSNLFIVTELKHRATVFLKVLLLSYSNWQDRKSVV